MQVKFIIQVHEVGTRARKTAGARTRGWSENERMRVRISERMRT